MNIARAAAQISTLEHYIWSTQPSAKDATDGELEVPHMDCKARVDARIKNELPDLAHKTTFLYVGYYPSNMVMVPMMRPSEDVSSPIHDHACACYSYHLGLLTPVPANNRRIHPNPRHQPRCPDPRCRRHVSQPGDLGPPDPCRWPGCAREIHVQGAREVVLPADAGQVVRGDRAARGCEAGDGGGVDEEMGRRGQGDGHAV
jgi:hypothetical protein